MAAHLDVEVDPAVVADREVDTPVEHDDPIYADDRTLPPRPVLELDLLPGALEGDGLRLEVH